MLPSPTVIPLLAPAPDDEDQDQPRLESEEERLLRLRRELNVAVRERPQDLQAWIQLASLQDALIQYAPCIVLDRLLRREAFEAGDLQAWVQLASFQDALFQ